VGTVPQIDDAKPMMMTESCNVAGFTYEQFYYYYFMELVPAAIGSFNKLDNAEVKRAAS
jgi:hypothetical protein